ncbi:DUF4276 family protein [Hymenobacter guriensis]|uniref:DUF4276 family protein n=1 Tax=Hymenobacter guriensis TaxID=2793065 RepID=A0ABS0L7B9_9BACT|nr:DUF4276 family protein [Hymenobacter guriensis]MBG8556023.1 DUF4276 family protein [Hymenobacter guriensis]
MSIRINITAEGQTEESFINNILGPHLAAHGKVVHTRRLRTSKTQRGGYTSFKKAQADIDQWLKNDPAAWHTTLIDLYGLNSKFPGYTASKHLPAHAKVAHIEHAFGAAIGSHRFIPFIQLHEFESLLFADPVTMEEWLGIDHTLPANCFSAIHSTYNGQPELINDSRETAPSKRILKLCPGYRKIVDGIMVLEEIGLAKMRQQCPHFNDWVTRLEQLT